MGHRTVVATVVVGLSIGARVSAFQTKQADIDTCNKVAASTGESPGVAPTNEGNQPTPRESNRNGAIVDHRQPAASAAQRAPESHANASAREAFAACLAQHGYYKGYYR